jgi:predicted nucleotidyltransferase
VAHRKLRDRDAIVSREGLILRVYGYDHPREGYVCDVEYAPSTLYTSPVPKAIRSRGDAVFYKFYEDAGLKFVETRYPQYRVYHEPLQTWLVGMPRDRIAQVRLPGRTLQRLLVDEPADELLRTLHTVLETIVETSTLRVDDLGVFGSLLHGIHHPQFSDIDLVVYGRAALRELRRLLAGLYRDAHQFVNEFDTAWDKTTWRFTRMTLAEYGWHQRRKRIYGVYTSRARPIMVEFEPVKRTGEDVDEYDTATRIERVGWVEATGRVVGDADAAFMPSIYQVELDDTSRRRAESVTRIVSYVEEFRMQVQRDERFTVAGHLERVTTRRKTTHQITLTYGSNYFDQVLKRSAGGTTA